jgi:hypothetical protein
MLVTSDGVQMPSNRDIAAVPINGAQSNRSFYKCPTHSYLCGCANNHLADVRIAFEEDFNMGFISIMIS